MKAGVIGSGAVGRVLATAFLKEGFNTMLSSRNSDKPELLQWKESNPSGVTGSFAEAAAFGDILVLAVKGTMASAALSLCDPASLQHKLIIDATNPIADAAPVDGVLTYFTDLQESLMEQLQRAHPQARFVKAFSCVGNAMMYQPNYNGVRPTMFICGNDADSRKQVSQILDRFGWETADMGVAAAARFIEPLAGLWCIRGFRQNEWTHAFHLLRK
jgi:predicted dinucleotide-binding enzyme